MATPNWTTLAILYSSMYLNEPNWQTTKSIPDRDDSLTLLGQQITDQMITYLDNSSIDPTNPPLSLNRACLEQTAYEWKQRESLGLSSVKMQDGDIHKYSTGEFLPAVEKILKQFRSFALYETNLS